MFLDTDRLTLRTVALTDIASIHALHSLPETDEFNTLGIPDSLAVTEQLVDIWLAAQIQAPRTSFIFCIEAKETKTFIGLIAINLGKEKYFTGEVWYKLHKDHWGKGYATEALNGILAFAFNTLHLHRIEAGCAADNIASAKVLEKTGFTQEGRTRKKLPIRGNWHDNFFYGILEEDFSGLAD